MSSRPNWQTVGLVLAASSRPASKWKSQVLAPLLSASSALASRIVSSRVWLVFCRAQRVAARTAGLDRTGPARAAAWLGRAAEAGRASGLAGIGGGGQATAGARVSSARDSADLRCGPWGGGHWVGSDQPSPAQPSRACPRRREANASHHGHSFR